VRTHCGNLLVQTIIMFPSMNASQTDHSSDAPPPSRKGHRQSRVLPPRMVPNHFIPHIPIEHPRVGFPF
jgi:hypothetical protein